MSKVSKARASEKCTLVSLRDVKEIIEVGFIACSH